VGYQPADRDHPDRIGDFGLTGVDVLMIADTYGVYRDDLKDIENRIAHNDYNPILFGRIDDEDADAIRGHVSAGGAVTAEFNTFMAPTLPRERRRMEDLFGVEWSGWVGRVFPDPWDELDTPAWLSREYEKQFGAPLPHAPMLVFVDDSGVLKALSTTDLGGVTPWAELTDAGRERFDDARKRAPYFYWWALVRSRPGTDVFAEFALPDIPGMEKFLESIEVAPRPPLLTIPQAPPLRAHFAGEFVDLDFDPGTWDKTGIARRRGGGPLSISGPTSEPAYWRIWAPIVEQLLREEEAARR